VSDVRDIETSSGNGGGDKDGGSATSEGGKRSLTLTLGSVSVDRGGWEPIVGEEVAEHVGHPLGLGEDERQASLLLSRGLGLGGKDVEQDGLLLVVLDVLDSLGDVLRSRSDSTDHEEAERSERWEENG
jgi:hypothetical protein